MPFIRHARDKRGYETTYVMHAYRPLQGPQRTRVLYLFRSPSHIKLGRHPLDEEIREALEHTHPDVSFDWSALGRESISSRPDEGRDRDRERHRPDRQERRGPPAQSRPVPAPLPVVLDDQSALGRALGAERAAELRTQYGDLLQRIARRSRTPEDRDRLTQRAQRLNPDDWPDDTEIRAHAGTVLAEWEALVAELPSRRRGRRGGRRRDRPDEDAPGGAASSEPGDDASASDEGTSGIMADGGNLERNAENAPMDRPDRPADDRRDDGGDGAEHANEPAGDGLPGDD
ncbi:MAG: hypothetical protein ABI634_11870 [Acidobacteriota bacterium]